ncbi:MAG: mechanosensitive ion channel family protein [Elusimicrobia bacterium]|nr:mechanosensitive ion channel family protein [Elusimicrobiota bacterium]
MSIIIRHWVFPLLAVAAGYVLGRFFDRIVLRKLESLSGKTAWEGDDIILRSLEGVTTVLFTAGGAYIAAAHLPLRPAMAGLTVKVLQTVVILAATFSAASMAGGFGDLYSGKFQEGLRHTSILTNVIRVTVFILGVLIVMQTLGISIAPILTALGVGGLAVALALQDTLSNLFAGFHIIVSKQVRPGDYVKLDSADEGYVADISWRFTSIKTLANNMVIVPNAKLAGAIVTNFHQPDKEIALVVPVRVGCGSELARVEKVSLEVAREVMKGVAGGIPDFEPLVRFQSFGDDGVELAVVLRCREVVDQYLVKHEFVRRLFGRYRQEGIEIPFPVRAVRLTGQTAPGADRQA